MGDRGLGGVLGAGQRAGRARLRAARAGRRRADARRARRVHRIREGTRRKGPRLDQGQPARQGRRRPAIPDREESPCAGAGRDPGKNCCARRGRDPVRRRFVRRGGGLYGRAAPEGRPRSRPGGEGVAAALGGGLPHVRA